MHLHTLYLFIQIELLQVLHVLLFSTGITQFSTGIIYRYYSIFCTGRCTLVSQSIISRFIHGLHAYLW